MTTFSELGVNPIIIKALDELEISRPTEIQIKTIPVLLQGNKDMLAVSHTGTGKTAAFGIPLLQQIDHEESNLQALILCPTRELAQQISSQLRAFAKFIPGINISAVFGGADTDKQITELEKYPPQVLVATPGRLIDLINRDFFDLDYLSHFILDEADEMLRKGFKEDIDYIHSLVEHSMHTWMFCATMNADIEKKLDRFLERNYVSVQSNPDNMLNPDIEHQYMVCKLDQKREGLKHFLKVHADKNGIVFCRTKAAVDEITEYLQNNGFNASAIHSDLTQKERDAVMKRFRSNEVRILVATDIAARGLDVTGLGFVVHYHLPEQREYFNHRSGRTGRAGMKGISLLIVFQKEVKKVNAIANNLGLFFTKVDYVISDPNAAAYQEVKPLNSASSEEGMVTFYINMGKVDEVNRKNLVEFICAEAGVKPSDFGAIKVEAKRSYFDIHHTAIRKLVNGLKNLVVDGKPLVLTRQEFSNES